MVQHPLRASLSAPERLRDHDQDATRAFFLGLVMSGLAMQATQSSRPASGAEHLISHQWEMTGLTYQGQPLSHGTKVGIGTVLVSLLYERLLLRDLSRVDSDARVAALASAAEIERCVRASLPAGEIADRAVVESLAKLPTADQLRARLQLLHERWPTLRERIREQLLPADALRGMLGTLGAAATPAQIGVSAGKLRSDLLSARLIRRRYTVLDLASELGLLDDLCAEVIDTLYAPPGAAQPTPRVRVDY
jgi:glycerol-1-phosphate dehydrogenase [NAD(P)+]